MKKLLLTVMMALSTSSVWAGGIATGLGLGASSGVSGSGSGFYAGASLSGLTGELKDACDENDVSCRGWKLYGGYKFNPNFGVEAGYHNLLDIETDVGTAKINGISVAGIAGMPLGESAEVFGKLGVLSSKADTTYKSIKSGDDTSKKSTDLLVGVGAGYKFTSNLGVRGEYEHVKDDEGSTGILSGGLTYSTF